MHSRRLLVAIALIFCPSTNASSLLFLPKTTFRVGMLINVPFYDNIFHGLMFRGNYPLTPTTPAGNTTLLVDRWSIYASLEGLLRRVGTEGRPCLLRAVCEAASHHLDHDGLLGALLHLLLSPSKSTEKISKKWHKDYIRAEKWGLKNKDCVQKYGKKCPNGVLDIFTTLL